MLLSLMNMLVFGIAGFLLMYIFYRPHLQKFAQTQQVSFNILPLPYIAILYTIGTITAYFFADNQDFIEPLTLLRAFLPLFCAAMIYISFMLSGNKGLYLSTIVAVALSVWQQPFGIAIQSWGISPYAIYPALFFIGVAFCLGMLVFNILPHLPIIQLAAILFGICILCFVGASPLFVALCAALLIGLLCAFLSLNYYEIKTDLDDGACVSAAYLVYYLMLLNLGELSFPSCLIFTMFVWAELVVALYHKYILSTGGMLRENTNCYAGAEVLTLQGLSANVLRICAVLLFIGWFQLFAVNQYSLLIVAFGLALWLGGSLGRTQPNSLKEINQEFIGELKQNITATKNLILKNKKDDEEK